jgi:hypothetical protein
LMLRRISRVGFSFSAAAGQVVLGFGVVAHSGVGDGVDGLVECSVSASVESVAGGLAAGGFDGAGSGECGEGGVVAAAPGVGEGDDGLGGADRTDSGSGVGFQKSAFACDLRDQCARPSGHDQASWCCACCI